MYTYNQTLTINVNGRKPSVEEAKELTEFELSKGIQKNERKEHKKDEFEMARKGLFFAVICTVLTIGFVILLEKDIVLFSTNTMDFKINPLLILFPGGFGLFSYVFSITKFISGYKSPLQNSPKKLLKTLFLERFRYGGTYFDDIVPSELLINKDKIDSYSKDFSKMIGRKITTLKRELARGEKYNEQADLPKEYVQITSMRKIFPNIYEVNAVISENNTFYHKKSSGFLNVQYNINCFLVNRKQYWFPYDLTPDFTINE